MAQNTVDIGHGIDVSWGADTTTSNRFGWEVTNLDWSGISAEAIDTTQFRTSTSTGAYYRTFLAGDAIDGGQVTLNFHFDPSTGPTNIVGATNTLGITFWSSGDTAGSQWSASCIGTGFDFSAEPNDKMMATATFQVAGAVTT